MRYRLILDLSTSVSSAAAPGLTNRLIVEVVAFSAILIEMIEIIVQ